LAIHSIKARTPLRDHPKQVSAQQSQQKAQKEIAEDSVHDSI
jgi:hypothetical protein